MFFCCGNSCCFDGTVKIWDAATLRPKAAATLTISRHTSLVYAIAYSPDGDYFATAGADRGVHVWSSSDGSLVRTFMGPSAAFDVAFSPTGGKVAVAYASGAAAVIDLRR